MRYENFLNDVLGQKSKVKALRFLSVFKKEISIRELSNEIKVTPSNLSIILGELEKQGVLVSRRIGTSIAYTLNGGHFLVDEVIKPLFKKESESKAELAEKIKKNFSFPYESLILFGSIARREERPESDIDLAVIIDDKLNVSDVEVKIAESNPEIVKKFGNSLSSVVIKKSDFLRRLENNDKLVASITKEGV